MTDLLEPSRPLIGHGHVRTALMELLEPADTATLTMLTGSVGSGKSVVSRWLLGLAGDRAVDVRAKASFRIALDPDGKDVGRLVEDLRSATNTAGDQAILVYSDIDRDLREPGIQRFVQEAISKLDVGTLVLTMTTGPTSEVFPLPSAIIALDQRHTDEGEFQGFLDACLAAVAAPGGTFSTGLRRALHDLSEQTSDFRTVEFVIELLLARWRTGQTVIRVGDLQDLLGSDSTSELRLPAIRMTDDRRMVFTRKDKTELLADVLRRAYPDPDDLLEVCTNSIKDFDAQAFRAETARSYGDAIISLCLTNSPVELVSTLLPVATIRAEIKSLALDPEGLSVRREAQAELLVRGLGFTLIGAPRGLRAFQEVVDLAGGLLQESGARLDVVNGTGAQITQQVEAALNDIAGFWAAFLCGSLAESVRRYNEHTRSSRQLRVRKLALGDILALLEFLNDAARDEESAFRLKTLRIEQPVSRAVLEACRRFIQVRNDFVHFAGSSTGVSAPKALSDLAEMLVETATRLLAAAADGTFPALVKLSEIVFDEYSRRIFRAVDGDGNEIRFTLTDEVDAGQLLVAAHYYMLPLRRVSVNPHVVPRAGAPVPVFAGRADAYAKHSSTQQAQSERLLRLVDAPPTALILDVGCGPGREALELGRRFPQGQVLGIDISPDMVTQAAQAAQAQKLDNVSFEEGDLLSYDRLSSADVLVSSSTMHWFPDPRVAYQQLLHLLRPGGQLVVHQGGRGTYRGLHDCARQVIRDFGLEEHYEGWNYPLYYPTSSELRSLVEGVGFIDVKVEPHEYEESKTVIRDFVEAGLRPYIDRLPEVKREAFASNFLDHARRAFPSLYTHRLYLTARRP